MRALIALAAAVATMSSVAFGDSPDEDFAFEVKEYTGSYTAAYVISKLTTFKVGKKCWAKLADKNQSALHSAAFWVPHVIGYAKAATGDDWREIETQSNNDREHNKALVEPMVDAFRARFHLTITIDGDDCVAKHNSLWLRYWSTIGTALDSLPAQKKLDIRLHVTPKVKAVTVSVDKSKSTFTITAPRDIEPDSWDDVISKPFRKLGKR